MGNSVARNVLLLVMAMSVGFALGAVMGYDLRIDNSTPALLVVGDKRNGPE
jgi:hypothetical protein